MEKPKVIAMIPARLGSKRVPKKGLRLIAGKPLVSYAIEAAKRAGCFDAIYLNSDAEDFAPIAKAQGIEFYKRPEALGSDETNNDQFLEDFMRAVPSEILVQLLPTSPLILPEEIRGFVSRMLEQHYDTLVSVVNHQIANIFENRPVNFSRYEPHKSSQTMTPVQSYATVLMGWRYENFFDNLKRHGGAYHGADGKIGYYSLKGFSTIDIDQEEDIALAEVALEYRNRGADTVAPRYYEQRHAVAEHAEVHVPEILKNDGVMISDFAHENVPLSNVSDMIAVMPNSQSWCRRLVNTENNSATLICQIPGEGNRLHYHPNWNEWWYIIQGQWQWEIEGSKYMIKAGDFVFIQKGKRHRITAVGNGPAIRLAVSRADVPHIYPNEEVRGQRLEVRGQRLEVRKKEATI